MSDARTKAATGASTFTNSTCAGPPSPVAAGSRSTRSSTPIGSAPPGGIAEAEIAAS